LASVVISRFLKQRINKHRKAAGIARRSHKQAEFLFESTRSGHWDAIASISKTNEGWHKKRLKRLQVLRRLITKNPRKSARKGK